MSLTDRAWAGEHASTIASMGTTCPTAKAVLKKLRERIGRLAEAGYCGVTAPWHLVLLHNQIYISEKVGAKTHRHFDAIPLNWPACPKAVLHISVRMKSSEPISQLDAYTVAIEDPAAYAMRHVRIDFDPQCAGQGPCSHPALHGHVGNDLLPELRYPLPALMPWDALDWLMATIDARFECDPWRRGTS